MGRRPWLGLRVPAMNKMEEHGNFKSKGVTNKEGMIRLWMSRWCHTRCVLDGCNVRHFLDALSPGYTTCSWICKESMKKSAAISMVKTFTAKFSSYLFCCWPIAIFFTWGERQLAHNQQRNNENHHSRFEVVSFLLSVGSRILETSDNIFFLWSVSSHFVFIPSVSLFSVSVCSDSWHLQLSDWLNHFYETCW